MRYIIFFIVTGFLITGSFESDVQEITPWLLGINFTLAIFSINFTFFGQQLSNYKAVYSKVTARQWINIAILTGLPFFPLACFLLLPSYFDKSALWAMPVLIFSAIDNALLTARYLSPQKHIKRIFSKKVISQYLSILAKEVKNEANRHQKYLDNRDKFKIPNHAYNFTPTSLGLEVDDIWDSVTVISILAIKNNDYPVFRQSINAVIKLFVSSYFFNYKNDYDVNSGIREIARNRVRSIIAHISDHDKSGIFLQSLSNEFCDFLMEKEALDKPCSEMTISFASDTVWVGQKMLEGDNYFEPIKILNTLHGVAEITIHRLLTDDSEEAVRSTDGYDISAYAYYIKSLGETALNNGNSHFAYRCMESLSYLGCNAAKAKSNETIVAVFESLVQLGRLARKLNIGCFWSRCLIPIESHAEEFMGHILTWLVQDVRENEGFFMRGYAEQAYSRLRGIKCAIKYVEKDNPRFWIEELKKDGQVIPHIERESGMYGYGGQSDYSDFSNLKDYKLYGTASESESIVFRSPPIRSSICEETEE